MNRRGWRAASVTFATGARSLATCAAESPAPTTLKAVVVARPRPGWAITGFEDYRRHVQLAQSTGRGEARLTSADDSHRASGPSRERQIRPHLCGLRRL